MPVTEVSGIPIYYEVEGSGEPLVLLNGVMMTTRSWALQTPAFSSRYRCILHDFRGQLMSLSDTGAFSMQQHVEDLIALMDHLEIKRAHLVGTSYGGEVGMMAAIEHPDRVRSLTVISSVSHVEEPLRQQVLRWIETAREAPERLYEISASDNFSQGFREQHPDLIAQGSQRLMSYPPEWFEAFAALCEAFLELDITDRLHEITCPSLVMCGEEDALKTPDYSRIIANRIPEGSLVLIPGAGHAVVLEAADQVNGEVRRFLTQHQV